MPLIFPGAFKANMVEDGLAASPSSTMFALNVPGKINGIEANLAVFNTTKRISTPYQLVYTQYLMQPLTFA